MKAIFMFLILTPSLVFAQKVDMKDIDADDEETTISISKGKKNTNNKSCDPIWEVTDGNADISGDSTIMAKDANQSWKKACEKWEKDFRKDNQENKILSVSCGKADCTTDAAGKVCTSKATYKLKTKLN
jgi:hypothetical protein